MKIIRVVLTNVGPFGPAPVSSSPGYSFTKGKHSFELKHGSIGVFGPNGSGKSSLVDLIYSAITGDFGRFDGVRVECVNNLAGEKEESSIRVDLEHNGVAVSVMRPLQGGKFWLRMGENTITDRKECTDVLAREGLTKRVLDFCVFKRQPGSEKHAIDDFLRTTPAARVEAYTALNQIEQCSLVYDVVGKFLENVYLQDVEDNSDELRAQLVSLLEQKTACLFVINSLKDQLLSASNKRAAEQLVESARRHLTVSEELNKLRPAHEENKGLLAKARSRAEQRKKEWQRVEAALAAHRAAFEEARDMVRAWAKANKAAARREELLQARAMLELEARQVQPPGPWEGRPPQELAEERAALRARARDIEARITVFKGTGLTACPTCATPVSNFEHLLKKDAAWLDEAPGLIRKVEAAIRAQRGHEESVTAYKAWQATHAERARANAEALAQLQEQGAPQRPLSHYTEVIDAHEELLEKVAAAAAAHQESAEALTRLEATQGEWARRLAVLEKARVDTAVAPAALEHARARLAEHREAEIAIAREEGGLHGLITRVADNRAQMTALRARMARNKAFRTKLTVLQGVREVFHATGLPSRVAQTNLGLMVKDINEGLALFGSPFSVAPADGLSFLVSVPGSPPCRAERLSGGQKVVLAVAFWSAISALYRSSLGLLVLDEPTANLDEDNVKYLRDALVSLTAKARGARQVIMITHESGLMGAFDQVIELRKP